MKKYLLVEMPDFSVWRVPTQIIADARTDYYAERCGEDRKKVKAETERLFAANEFEIEDWAANNMDWDEVKAHAVQVKAGEVDYQEGWVNGNKCVTDNEEQKDVV
ncbi:hypothetical protein [Eikenella corrodens]|uniref:hypothetical protein n=1 Tax=Eikenella corrodens TaxID=539 RepID=UPI00129B1D36|nr:hypothetical protein [Eikenella corrodens]